MLLNPTGWAKTTLDGHEARDRAADVGDRERADGLPDRAVLKHARNYYPFKSQEELTAWNNLFVPITQGA